MPLLALPLPSLVLADVMICDFAPTTCLESVDCAPFEITINMQHGADTPHFDYGGVNTPIVEVSNDGAETPSFITLGHADREIITLFNGFDAVHTRHFGLNDVSMDYSAAGQCVSFY